MTHTKSKQIHSRHKWSSIEDTHQNQLAKYPNRTSYSKEKFSLEQGREDREPLDLLGLVAHWLIQMHLSVSPGKILSWQQCWAKKKQGPFSKQMVSAPARNIPPNLSGPASHHGAVGSWPPSLRTAGTSGFAPEIPGAKCRKSTAITHWEPHAVLITILAHRCSQWLYSREPGGPRHCQNTAVPLWVPKNCYQNWGMSAPCSEVNEEARLVERKVCSFSEADKREAGGWTHFQRWLPALTIRE